MSTHPAARFVAPDHTDDQRWRAWLARGKAHERLVNQRLTFVAALVACAVIGGLLVTLVIG
jgi:hypothetical protein